MADTPILWFPALSSTGALALAIWLFRRWITERLARSIQHDLDRKLEALRSSLRESEERLKAELREKEIEIAHLRSGALSAMASRQMNLDKRRLDAIDQLWASVNSLTPARYIASMMGAVKFDAAATAAESDPRMREFFATIGNGFEPSKLDHSGAAKARPFVSASVWAAYSALLSVIMFSVFRWMQIKGGLGARDFGNHEAIRKVIKAALPDWKEDYLDSLDPSNYQVLIEPLEDRLLQSIRSMLAGEEDDKAAVERAQRIVKYTNEAMRQPQTTG